MRGIMVLFAAMAGICVMSLAQFGGEWQLNMTVFPNLVMEETRLKLSYSWANLSLCSISDFTLAGFEEQTFQLAGSLGPIILTGSICFNASDSETVVVYFDNCVPQTISYTLISPQYKYSWVKATLLFGGAELSLRVNHWAFPYYVIDSRYTWPCCTSQTASSTFMRYTVCFKASPFSSVANFEDCCSGITFKDLAICLTDLSPCCDLFFSMEFYFTKKGFQYLLLSADNIPICCSISFDVSMKLTETSKQVSISPEWTGFGELCYEIYGDVDFNSGMIEGVTIYGFRFRCSFGDCNWVEYVEAFDVSQMEEVLEEIYCGKEEHTSICEDMCSEMHGIPRDETCDEIFRGDEDEYFRFHFCGASCCDGRYLVDVTIFFRPGAELFGMSRASLKLEVPIMSNMVFLNNFSVTTTGDTELEVGWRITF